MEDAWLIAKLIGGFVPAAIAYKYLRRRKQQREFWDGILSEKQLNSYRVICGGSGLEFADEVRGKPVPASYLALYELIRPMWLEPLLESLQKIQVESEVWFDPFGDKARRKIRTLGDLVTKIVASRGVRLSRILQINKTLEPHASLLALPFLGHVSNSFVEQHLRNTQHFRRLRVVATKPGHASPRELTTENEVQALRDEKESLIQHKGSNIPEHVVLDREINYEIWSNDVPEARPHFDSHEHKIATDSVYVLFSRPPPGSNEAVLSVQPLHPLSLAAMSLFHRPLETLRGKEAEKFRLAAFNAMRDPNSIGFEAILNVQKNRQEVITETPRHFRGSPDLSAVTVSVKKAPQPLRP